MGKLNVNVKVVNNSDGTKDANLTIGSPDGSIGVGVLMDAPSLRNVAALFIKTADEMERVIVMPQRSVYCGICAGINPDYSRVQEMFGSLIGHRRLTGGDGWTACIRNPSLGDPLEQA